MKKLLLLFAILNLFHHPSFSQNRKTNEVQNPIMDSLNLELKKAKQDTTRLRIYLALCDACDINDNLKYTEPLIKLLDKFIEEAPNDKKKKHYLEKKADAYGFVRAFYDDKKDTAKTVEVQKIRINIYQEAKDTEAIIGQMRGLSNYYMSFQNYPKGIEYCEKALAMAKEMNYKKGIAGCLRQIGEIYKGQGENAEAMEKFQQSSSIYSELKDTIALADVLVSEGLLYCQFHDYKKALECYNRCILLYEIKKEKRGVRKGYDCIAGVYIENNDFPNAMVYLQKCLSMSEEMKDNYWIGLSLKSIGNIYSQQGYYDKALAKIKEALIIYKNLRDETQTGWSYNRLADTYFKQKNYSTAKLYSDSSLAIEKKQAFISNLQNGELLATKIDSARGDGNGAYEHYKQYILLSNKLKSEEVHQLAQKEKYQNEYDKQKAIDKAISDNEIEKQKIVRNSFIGGFALMILLAGVSYRNFRRKKKDNKIIETQKAELQNSFSNLELLNNISTEITSSLNIDNVMSEIYKNLSSIMDISFFIIATYHESEKNVEIKYCVKDGKVVREEFKTSILNPDSYTAWTIKNKSEIIIMDEEKERSNYLNSVRQLHGKEDMMTDTVVFIPLLINEKVIGLYSVQSVKKNAYTKTDINILRSLSPVIAVALNNADSYNKLDTANVEIVKQKTVVEEKQREILDSIEYALRIQTAILPPNKTVKKYLENSFILYKPKDIVAGDFYWMETVQFTDETMKGFTDKGHPNIGTSAHQIILFAACDCTGHGVPGAMVSVVCNNALNRAVREFGLTQPAAILDKTSEIVIENFSKSEEDIKDGMDISLCSLTLNPSPKERGQDPSYTLQWAGANNPLWLLQNGELIETKADKQPIGRDEDSKPFTNHSFNLKATDTIYLFTDGFADQFGGDTGEKKLTKKRFKDLILSIQNLSMQEQGAALDKFIIEYRKEVEQIDDILVMGVKI